MGIRASFRTVVKLGEWGVHVKLERVYSEPGGQTGSESLLEVFLEDCGIYVLHYPVLQGRSIVWVFSFFLIECFPSFSEVH